MITIQEKLSVNGIEVHSFETDPGLQNKLEYTIIRDEFGEHSVQVIEYPYNDAKNGYDKEPIRTWKIKKSGISITNQLGEVFEIDDMRGIAFQDSILQTTHFMHHRFNPLSLRYEVGEILNIIDTYEVQANISLGHRVPVQFKDKTLKNLTPVYSELDVIFRKFKGYSIPLTTPQVATYLKNVLGQDYMRFSTKDTLLVSEIGDHRLATVQRDYLEVTNLDGELEYLKFRDEYAIPISASDDEYTFLRFEKSWDGVRTWIKKVSRIPRHTYELGRSPESYKDLVTEIFADSQANKLEVIRKPEFDVFLKRFEKLEELFTKVRSNVIQLLEEEFDFVKQVSKSNELSKVKKYI